MPKNKVSKAKTAIVTEKPADSSVTMTRNAYHIRNTTPAPPLSYMDSALLSTLRRYVSGSMIYNFSRAGRKGKTLKRMVWEADPIILNIILSS